MPDAAGISRRRFVGYVLHIDVGEDGTVSFDLHRTEVGQGVNTAVAMVIAEEMGVPVESVWIGQADARPELLFNQLTGGSNSMYTIYEPVRIAAAVARKRLLRAAGLLVGSLTYPPRHRGRADPHTGGQRYVADLDVPDALPTMVARPPTVNGRPRSVLNEQEVLAVPGVTDVAMLDTGVAIRARTFGQCIDALQVIEVEWDDGPAVGLDDTAVSRSWPARNRRSTCPTWVAGCRGCSTPGPTTSTTAGSTPRPARPSASPTPTPTSSATPNTTSASIPTSATGSAS